MLVLLGSHALNKFKFVRTPIDIDLLGTYDAIQEYIKVISKHEKIKANYPSDSGKKIIVKTDKNIYEFEVAWPDSNAEVLLDLIKDGEFYEMDHTGEVVLTIPKLDILYMLKLSHRYRKDSPHFKKTLDDILLMREMGAKIPSQYFEWFKWRESETYTNSLPKLNQSKKDFFDNSNNIYTLDHDSIHEAVKHLERPAYEYFKPDTAEVFTSKELFFNCPLQVRLYAALEEVMVLSIERSIFPFEMRGDKRRWAFDMAHMKLSTSISSGWFREFVWENYHAVQDMYNEEYIDKFYKALADGKIKPFEQTMEEAA